MTADRWFVGLTRTANADYDEILSWTAEHFGEAQAFAYRDILDLAIKTLASGANAIGVRSRDDITPGLFTLRLTSDRRRARHILVFRIKKNKKHEVEVLRILHDSMDLARHVQNQRDEEMGDEE